MKRIFALLFVALAMTAGCKGQQITPNPVTTAPPVTSTAFTQVTPAPGLTATSFVDQPATGSFCYFVQLLDGSGVSAASSVTCATTTSALKHVDLSWSFPAGYSCQSTCTYMVSRAAAVLSPVGVPALAPATNAAGVVKPALAVPGPQLARLDLTMRVR